MCLLVGPDPSLYCVLLLLHLHVVGVAGWYYLIYYIMWRSVAIGLLVLILPICLLDCNVRFALSK